jgi:hypothetical protein
MGFHFVDRATKTKPMLNARSIAKTLAKYKPIYDSWGRTMLSSIINPTLANMILVGF